MPYLNSTKLAVAALSLAAIASHCNASLPKQPTPTALEQHRAISGFDLEGDGIREDVWVALNNGLFRSPHLLQASLQYAKAYQKVIESRTLEQAKFASSEVMRATLCVLRTNNDDKETNVELLLDIIERLTVNSEPRIIAFEQFQDIMKNTPPQIGGADEICDRPKKSINQRN